MCVEPNGSYSICLAAPIHQTKGFNNTEDCIALNKLLSSGYPIGLQGGLRWNATNCGTTMTPGVKTADKLFYSCTVFKSVVEYSRMVQAVWALSQPSVAKGFATSYVNSKIIMAILPSIPLHNHLPSYILTSLLPTILPSVLYTHHPPLLLLTPLSATFYLLFSHHL